MMKKQEEDINRFINITTRVRVEAFRVSVNDSDERLVELYGLNLRLCEGLYRYIHVFEVAYRNMFDKSMKKNFEKDWLLSNTLREKEEEKILVVNKRFKATGRGAPTRDQMISELGLGFWFYLLEKQNEKKFLFKVIKDVFPNATKRDRKLSTIRDRFQSILILRNRLSHQEPISRMKNLSALVDDLLLMIEMIDPYLLTSFKDSKEHLEDFRGKVDVASRIYK